MQEKPTLDLSFLRKFCRDDTRKMALYIHSFLESAAEQLKVLNEAHGRSDYEKMRQIAHSLKPQAEFIGLPRMKHELEQIEKAAVSRNALNELSGLMLLLQGSADAANRELVETLLTLE